MRVVAALGGNAFVPPGAELTMESQFRFAREALSSLEPFLAREVELLVTHGNGPQVGHQLARAERSRGAAYDLPLDVCVAQTQGEMGYVLARTLRELLAKCGNTRAVAALVTQVEVDPADAAFRRPTKPVGPFLDGAQAEAMRRRGVAGARRPGAGCAGWCPRPIPSGFWRSIRFGSSWRWGRW
jgi:carbamate kinase